MNDINDFLGISVVGLILSIVIEMVKERFGTSSNQTRLITIGLSIAVGAAYWFLRDTVLWQTILGVLAAASTVYAMFLKPKRPADGV